MSTKSGVSPHSYDKRMVEFRQQKPLITYVQPSERRPNLQEHKLIAETFHIFLKYIYLSTSVFKLTY